MSNLSQQSEPAKSVICPECGDSEGIYSIQSLYTDLLSGKKMPVELRSGISRTTFIKQISPPQIPKKDLITSFHPDFVVILGLIVAIYALFTLLVDLKPFLIPIVLVITLILAIYVFFRRRFINRHNIALQQRTELLDKVRKIVDIWMELKYCPLDNLVFLTDHSLKTELSKLTNFLNSGLDHQG